MASGGAASDKVVFPGLPGQGINSTTAEPSSDYGASRPV